MCDTWIHAIHTTIRASPQPKFGIPRSTHRVGVREALLSHDGADLLGSWGGPGVAADGGTSYRAYSAAATEHLTRDLVPSGVITEGHGILVQW